MRVENTSSSEQDIFEFPPELKDRGWAESYGLFCEIPRLGEPVPPKPGVPICLVNVALQVRETANSSQEELTASIDALGFLQEPVMAVIGAEFFKEYLGITNKLWGGDQKIEDKVEIPGRQREYIFLFAGHSRQLAGLTLVSGYKHLGITADQFTIPPRWMKVDSVTDITSIQVAENIKSNPPPERAARAIAESFTLEKTLDSTLTKAEYCRRHGIKSRHLESALDYAELSPKIRELTDSNLLPFSLACELAQYVRFLQKMLPTEYTELDRLSSTLSEEEMTAKEQEIITLEILRLITKYNETRRRKVVAEIIKQAKENVEAKYKSNAMGDQSLDIGFGMSLFDASKYQERKLFLKEQIRKSQLISQGKVHKYIKDIDRWVTELVEMEGSLFEENVSTGEVSLFAGAAAVASATTYETLALAGN
jgi:hypothetical protein